MAAEEILRCYAKSEIRDAEGVEGEEVWEGVSPPIGVAPPHPTRGSGERRELPQPGPGQIPA